MRRPSNPLDPKVRLLWWTIGLLQAAIVGGAIPVVAVVSTSDFPEARGPFVTVAVVLAVLMLVIAVIVPPVRYRRWRYEIRERDVFLSKGAIFFEMTLVPFDRIQYVETRQGPLDRVFSLAQVHVYTAAGRAAQIPGLSIPEAQRLREELSKVAGTSSV